MTLTEPSKLCTGDNRTTTSVVINDKPLSITTLLVVQNLLQDLVSFSRTWLSRRRHRRTLVCSGHIRTVKSDIFLSYTPGVFAILLTSPVLSAVVPAQHLFNIVSRLAFRP